MVACIYKSPFNTSPSPLKSISYNKYLSLEKLRSVVGNKQSFKKQPSKKSIYKKKFVHNIRMLSLSLNELKQIAKIRGTIIKGYKNMSEETIKFS